MDLIASALAHIAAAEVHFAQTTIGYLQWKDRVDRGYYKDLTQTSWWKALNELALAKADLVQASPEVAAAGFVYLHGDYS